MLIVLILLVQISEWDYAGGWGSKGKFCDEEMSMCDGTNSFWCEHGGSCEEIVQGEK